MPLEAFNAVTFASYDLGVTEDPSAFNLVYDPENPDANKDGYVQKPNVDPLTTFGFCTYPSLFASGFSGS
jgi:hypothetical protein